MTKPHISSEMLHHEHITDPQTMHRDHPLAHTPLSANNWTFFRGIGDKFETDPLTRGPLAFINLRVMESAARSISSQWIYYAFAGTREKSPAEFAHCTIFHFGLLSSARLRKSTREVRKGEEKWNVFGWQTERNIYRRARKWNEIVKKW